MFRDQDRKIILHGTTALVAGAVVDLAHALVGTEHRSRFFTQPNRSDGSFLSGIRKSLVSGDRVVVLEDVTRIRTDPKEVVHLDAPVSVGIDLVLFQLYPLGEPSM